MFISLSSTMRMHSPVKATSVSLRCLPPRQEGVQLPQQGAGTVVSLHHDCLCGLAQARPVVFGEILHRPDDHRRAPAGLRPAKALEPVTGSGMFRPPPADSPWMRSIR